MTGILNALIAGVSGAVKDVYFNLVSLLLPGNGTNGAQNNTFLDGSSNNFTITRNGNTTQGTFSPFSQTGWGNYFDGSSYLSLSNGAVLAAGTSNFTAEFWVYATTDQQSQAYGSVFHVGDGTSGSFSISLLYSSAGAMKIRVGTFSTSYESTSTISTNRWYHIAVVREGTSSNQTKIYVDGSLFYTFTLSDNLSNSSGLYVGSTAFNISVRRLSGYVSNLRYIVGTALYTGAFTPSTSPLTTTSQGATASQVELLTCQNNRFLDNSSNGWTFTTSGSPSVQAFSPFAPTSSYSAAAVGGSGYFDGTGDYIQTQTGQTALTLGTGSFTISCWFYCPAQTQSNGAIFASNTSVTYTNAILLQFDNSTATLMGLAMGGSVIKSSIAVVPNAWNFIVVQRTAPSTMQMWVNGNEITGITASSANLTDNDWRVGYWAIAAHALTGYVSNFRIVKGTALYSGSTITVPTALLGSTGSDTSLLLNFTNAGVVDATAKNVLETVGNAQISTSVSKFGGGSMYFDGTGDYLKSNVSTSDLYGFGGDFAIELWLYRNATGQTILVDSRPTGGGGTSAYYVLYVNTSNVLSWFVGGSVRITGTTTISNSTWYHIAIARSGSSTKMYLNGTQEGSTYTDSTALICASGRPYVGADANDLTSNLNGYIDDLRITKGNARGYTGSTITVPTAPFPLQ